MARGAGVIGLAGVVAGILSRRYGDLAPRKKAYR